MEDKCPNCGTQARPRLHWFMSLIDRAPKRHRKYLWWAIVWGAFFITTCIGYAIATGVFQGMVPMP